MNAESLRHRLLAAFAAEGLALTHKTRRRVDLLVLWESNSRRPVDQAKIRASFLRLAGETYKQIGFRFDIGPARAQQVLAAGICRHRLRGRIDRMFGVEVSNCEKG